MTKRKRTDAEALELAQELAFEAMEEIESVMRNPHRNAQPKLAAAVKILDVAGVGVLQADQRHQELLRALKTKVSPEVYFAVLRAVAGDTESGSRTATH
jgi:hypothetical protein